MGCLNRCHVEEGTECIRDVFEKLSDSTGGDLEGLRDNIDGVRDAVERIVGRPAGLSTKCLSYQTHCRLRLVAKVDQHLNNIMRGQTQDVLPELHDGVCWRHIREHRLRRGEVIASCLEVVSKEVADFLGKFAAEHTPS